MKKLLFGICLMLLQSLSFGQLLLGEDFNFDGALSDYGWIVFSGTSNPIVTVTPGLFFDGYPGSGIGAAVNLPRRAGYDVYRKFPAQTKLYYSFLIKVVEAEARVDTGYVMFLGTEQNAGVNGNLNGNYFARVIIACLGDGTWKIGVTNWSITNSTNLPTYSSQTFELNKTYVVVVSLDFNEQYKVSAWVMDTAFPYLETEAGTPSAVSYGAPSTAALPKYVDAVGLRQDVSCPNVIIDALRIFTEWNAFVLPLKLLSFKGEVSGNMNRLHWVSVQEHGMSHFEIERSLDAKTFVKIGEIPCRNEAGEQTYSYVDDYFGTGHFYYRLKMVEQDGTHEYSAVIQLVKGIGEQLKIAMPGQRQIKVLLGETTDVRHLKVMDLNGHIVYQQQLKVGQTESLINLSMCPSGIYILVAENTAGPISRKFFLY